VVVDRSGKVHSLARRIRGATTEDIRRKLRAIEPAPLRSVQETRPQPREPRPVTITDQFRTAAREVSTSIPKGRERTSVPGRSETVRHFIESVAVITSMDTSGRRMARPPRIHAAPPALRYRSLRANLIADFAVKIESVRQNASADEVAAQIAALLAARDAALEALERQEGVTPGRLKRRIRSRGAVYPPRRARSRFRRRRMKIKPRRF
jgi:hypothetical protein